MEEKLKGPLVSCIIPSYNHEKYIKESLEGLFSQDYQNFEVIIRDDGSTDRTPIIIRDFVSKIKNIRITVEYGENIGLLKSYNWLLSKASGDIIMGCGSDDVFLPGRISYAVEMHKRYSDFDFFPCNGQVISDNGELIRESFYPENVMLDDSGIMKYENIDYKLAMNFSVGGFGMSFNKKLLKPVGYKLPETLLFEDGYISFLAAIQNGAILCYKPLIKYRRAINSLSRIDKTLDNPEILRQEKRFLQMFLSLEISKFDYLKKNLNVNEIIQKNKSKALRLLAQKILVIEIKINTIEGKISWNHCNKLLFLIVKGTEPIYSFKVLVLYLLFRRKFTDLIISEYKKRAAIL